MADRSNMASDLQPRGSPRRLRSRGKPETRNITTATATNTSGSGCKSSVPIIDLTDSPPMATSPAELSSATSSRVAFLPDNLTATKTGLSRHDHALLLKKSAWLRTHRVSLPRDMERSGLASCVAATLVFGQEEAGTAVCLSREGLLLTCSHCVAETAAELDTSQRHWLVFASGQIVAARTVAWDPQRDLALLRIVAAQADNTPAAPSASTRVATNSTNGFETASPVADRLAFPCVAPAASAPQPGTRLVCVGHPGSEDLEADRPGIKTHYDVVHLSTGTYRGCAVGQDPQDNAEIGALMHDCWTYWGHSGAPLMDRRTGRVVGLHSSWDEETGMRRGVPLEAMRAFLDENGIAIEQLRTGNDEERAL